MSPHSSSVLGRRVVFWMIVVSLTLLTYGATPLTNNLDDIKVTLLFCLFPLVMAVYLGFMTRGGCPAPPAAPSALLGVYIAVMVVSTLLSPFPWSGWYATGFTFAALGCFFGPVGAVRTRADLENLLLALVLICLGAEIIGIFHRLHGFGLLLRVFYPHGGGGAERGLYVALYRLFYTFDDVDYQMFSTILNRDFFAAYLNMMTPVALGLAVATGRAWVRNVALSCIGLSALCVLLAMSKNDYVIFVSAPVLFFLLYGFFVRQKRIRIPYWPLWLFGVLTVFGTIIFMRWTLFSDQLKLFAPGALSRTFESREIIWGGALGVWKDHPLLGGGPGTFKLLFPLHRAADYHLNDISTVTLYAHNLFLDYLSETGLIGAAAAGGFLVAILWLGFRQIRKDEDFALRTMQCGLFSGVAAILVASATSPLTRWPIGVANFYIVLGTAAAAINVSRPRRRQPAGPDAPEAEPRTSAIPASGARGAGRVVLGTILTAVAAGGAIWCMVYGARYFEGAMENQEGLFWVSIAEQSPDVAVRAYEEAAEHFEKALGKNPLFLTSYYKLAHVYHSLYRMDDAKSEEWLRKSLDAYNRLARLAPDYSEIHYNYGIIYESLGGIAHEKAERAKDAGEKQKLLDETLEDFRIAAAEYDKAAVQSSKLITQRAAARGHETLARVSAGEDRRQELEQALVYYRKLMKYDPNRPDVAAPIEEGGDPGLLDTQRAFGMLLQLSGYDDEAAEVLYHYLLREPGDHDASNALARALGDVKNTDRILAILDDLIASNPLRLDYRIYRYKMFFSLRQYDKALAEALKAHRLNSGDWTTLLYLGKCYLALNQVENGREYLAPLAGNPAAKTSPEGQEAAEILKRLDELVGAPESNAR